MATVTLKTPYASAMPYVTANLPSWISEYDAQRLASYDLYDDLYHSDPTTGAAVLKDVDDKPVLLPTAKRFVKTMARYIGRNWGFIVDPDSVGPDGTAATDEQKLLATTSFGDLFNREEVLQKFASGKREWLRRGDWVWYLLADPAKPAGSRISIRTIDPRNYFVLSDETDVDRTTGAAIIEQTLSDDGKTTYVKQQRWLKVIHPDHPEHESAAPSGFIAYESLLLALENWDDPAKRKIVQQLSPLALLDGIQSVPLYHVRNNAETGDPYGGSDMRGLESLFVDINQTMSDESTELAMSGLGMFWTDAGAPIDETTGKTVNWILGPRRVLEVPTGGKFGRLPGITSVQPNHDHIGKLEQSAFGVNGVNDVALGEATVTESGVALAIKMQPLFDEANDKDAAINSKLSQMTYDLVTWFRVYEEIDLGPVRVYVQSDTGNRLPFDRTAEWTELSDGYTNGWFTLDYVVKRLTDSFGYTFEPGYVAKALAEKEKNAALADPYGARAAGELNANGDQQGADGQQEDVTGGDGA